MYLSVFVLSTSLAVSRDIVLGVCTTPVVGVEWMSEYICPVFGPLHQVVICKYQRKATSRKEEWIVFQPMTACVGFLRLTKRHLVLLWLTAFLCFLVLCLGHENMNKNQFFRKHRAFDACGAWEMTFDDKGLPTVHLYGFACAQHPTVKKWDLNFVFDEVDEPWHVYKKSKFRIVVFHLFCGVAACDAL